MINLKNGKLTQKMVRYLQGTTRRKSPPHFV